MTVVVRQATARDATYAVPLLLDAGEHLLKKIYGDGDRDTAFAFLSAAWLRGTGQYGFANHWLACIEDEIVGIISCWHDSLPQHFDRDTLTSITDFFGLDEAIDVVMRSQAYTIALNPPMVLEMSIGHLAVAAGARRSGVATILVRYMENMARELGKLSLVLDVEEHNTRAIDFYKSMGFKSRQGIPPFIQFTKGIAPVIT